MKLVEGRLYPAMSRRLQMQWRTYRRLLASPMATAHGSVWARHGILLRLRDPDTGSFGLGEAAPLSPYCEERVSDLLEVLVRLGEEVEGASLMEAVRPWPSLGFAVSCALEQLAEGGRERDGFGPWPIAGLLASGSGAVDSAGKLREEGFACAKWKIGVLPMAEEGDILREIARRHPDLRLRLDANGSLSMKTLEAWLDLIVSCSGQVEFLEQPLPPGEEDRMLPVARESPVAIALDESCRRETQENEVILDWPGPLVLKPAWMGPLDCSRALVRRHPDVVWSSCLETAVGLAGTLRAVAGTGPGRPFGWGPISKFADGMCGLPRYTHTILPQDLPNSVLEGIWTTLLP